MQIATTHKNTDFDALASVVAATILYPEAIAVIPRIINPNVKGFLSLHRDRFNTVQPAEIDIDKVERLIVVDTNQWGRLEGMDCLSQKADLEIILWDHHLVNGDIQPAWKCQEQMGATITLMTRRLRAGRIKLTPIQATLFLAGLYEDTGNLTFPASQAEDAYAAAYFLEQKADLKVLASFLRPAYGPKQRDVLFQILESAQRTNLGGFRISITALEINHHVENLAVVLQMYREILDVEAAFGIFIDPKRGKSIVIGRSIADMLDVGAIMRHLGGGGHRGAGSAMVESVKAEKIQKRIEALIEGNQMAAIQIADLMSFPVLSVAPDTNMGEVAFILREKGVTGVPVLDGENLVGMISRRDFKKLKKESQLKAPVKAFMSKKVITVDPGRSPMQMARLMVKYDIGRIPVIENGLMIGIVTRSDSMRYFYELLPS